MAKDPTRRGGDNGARQGHQLGAELQVEMLRSQAQLVVPGVGPLDYLQSKAPSDYQSSCTTDDFGAGCRASLVVRVCPQSNSIVRAQSKAPSGKSHPAPPTTSVKDG